VPVSLNVTSHAKITSSYHTNALVLPSLPPSSSLTYINVFAI